MVAELSQILPAEEEGDLEDGLADFKALMEAPSMKEAPASFYGPLQIWAGHWSGDAGPGNVSPLPAAPAAAIAK